MAIVVFLRGANVGGHRRFRPAVLAKELAHYDVVNVGATGLFVVRDPGSIPKFRAELLRRLPFETQIAICDGRDVAALERDAPFDDQAHEPDVVRFVSVLLDPKCNGLPRIPFGIPSDDEWYVRLVGRKNQFVFGIYRRHMKTIAYLGQIDKVLGTAVTTRNWNTIAAVLKALKAKGK
jgi:uncharacterized protein (DUF1697 family)